MPLFNFNPNQTTTPAQVVNELMQPATTNTEFESFGKRGGIRQTETPSELANQFIVFQLSNQLEGSTILESSEVEPMISTTAEKSDVLVQLEMLSFHIAHNEPVDRNSRATMRIIIGKDENSRDKYFDTAFWTVSAGLKLYDAIQKKTPEAKDFKTDLSKAFGKRPIEIPGGLASLSFDVIKHREPKWWQRIFQFIQSDTGKTLTSVVGFPAITHTAINMLDELLNRLDGSEPEVLFSSRPLTLALTDLAKLDYTAGNPRIKVGTLNPGFCVLARGKDFHTIANASAYYYPAYGKLVPDTVSPGDLVSGNYEDPFKNITYAVFKVGMQTTKLDPSFNYGSQTYTA
ncbi:MAG: hypothetical protein AB8G22_17355 [Saprospiraceae bacterium]